MCRTIFSVRYVCSKQHMPSILLTDCNRLSSQRKIHREEVTISLFLFALLVSFRFVFGCLCFVDDVLYYCCYDFVRARLCVCAWVTAELCKDIQNNYFWLFFICNIQRILSTRAHSNNSHLSTSIRIYSILCVCVCYCVCADLPCRNGLLVWQSHFIANSTHIFICLFFIVACVDRWTAKKKQKAEKTILFRRREPETKWMKIRIIKTKCDKKTRDTRRYDTGRPYSSAQNVTHPTTTTLFWFISILFVFGGGGIRLCGEQSEREIKGKIKYNLLSWCIGLHSNSNRTKCMAAINVWHSRWPPDRCLDTQIAFEWMAMEWERQEYQSNRSMLDSDFLEKQRNRNKIKNNYIELRIKKTNTHPDQFVRR